MHQSQLPLYTKSCYIYDTCMYDFYYMHAPLYNLDNVYIIMFTLYIVATRIQWNGGQGHVRNHESKLEASAWAAQGWFSTIVPIRRGEEGTAIYREECVPQENWNTSHHCRGIYNIIMLVGIKSSPIYNLRRHNIIFTCRDLHVCVFTVKLNVVLNSPKSCMCHPCMHAWQYSGRIILSS